MISHFRSVLVQLWLCVCMSVCVLQYESSSLGLISSRLRTTLNRIQESLIDGVRLQLSHSCSHLPLFLLVSWHKQALSIPPTPTSSPFKASVFFCFFVFFASIHRDQARPHSPCRPKMHYRSSLCGQRSLTRTRSSLSLFKWKHQGCHVLFHYPQSLLLSDIIQCNN